MFAVFGWAMFFAAVLCALAGSAGAAAPDLFTTERVKGTDLDGQPNTAIYDKVRQRLLVEPRSSREPKDNLTGFSHLSLSPEGSFLFFQTHAWAVSDAVHRVQIATGNVSFVTDGEIACVLGAGKWRGDLVVDQHRYYVQGGSHDDLWLYDPSGHQLGLVKEGEEPGDVCARLEE